jgi:hypothetical protein
MANAKEGQKRRRCDRNRKRSKRRAIYCPVHQCYLDSVSRKYPLFAHTPGQLRERGLGRQSASLVVATYGTIPLPDEWLEEFWCQECQATNWYHVRRQGGGVYSISIAPAELWQQATGVVHPQGNVSVGEFTRRQARMTGIHGLKGIGFIK